jgi:hypothetical protein
MPACICILLSLQNTYSLAQRSALTNGNLITIDDTESWGNVGGQVLVSLLISGVFGDEVEVFSADNEGSVHLGRNNSSGQDTTADGNETGEWALLVCKSRTLVLVSYIPLAPSSLRMDTREFEIPCKALHETLCPSQSCNAIRRPWLYDISHTNVVTLDGSLGCAESQPNVLVPSLDQYDATPDDD